MCPLDGKATLSGVPNKGFGNCAARVAIRRTTLGAFRLRLTPRKKKSREIMIFYPPSILTKHCSEVLAPFLHKHGRGCGGRGRTLRRLRQYHVLDARFWNRSLGRRHQQNKLSATEIKILGYTLVCKEKGWVGLGNKIFMPFGTKLEPFVVSRGYREMS